MPLARAARRLVRTPGFTLVVVVNLGLGIGLASAAFAGLDTIVLAEALVHGS